jgi:hypothetical protein
MKWPHEIFIGNLQFFLVELTYIIKEKEWWWWWSFWQRFVRFQKVDHLLFNLKSSLVNLILVNLVNFSRDGQHESC